MASIVVLSAAKAVFTVLITPANFGIMVMIVPTADMTFPTMISTGPIAAATSAMVMMTLRVPSSIEFSQSTKFCTQPTMERMAGISISPKEMASSSSWDLRIVSCPARLSCMVFAIDSAVPSQFAMALESFAISFSPAFIRARKPDIAFLPTSDSAAFAFSDSDSLENAARQSARISDSPRMEPSALVV